MNRLREERVLRRVSQFRLRLGSNVHQSKISLIENGLVEAREDEKKRLAKALGVKVAVLFPDGKEGDNVEPGE